LPAVGAGLAVWIIPATLSTIGLVFFALFVINGEGGNLQCAVALAVTAVPFAIAALDDPNRLLHPLSVVGFTMLLGVAGQTVYLTHPHGQVSDVPDPLSGLGTDLLTPGLMVVSAAVAALAIGYAVGGTNDLPKPGRLLRRAVSLGLASPSPRRTFWAALVVCAVSIVAFAVYAPKVGIHSPADLLTSQKRFGDTGGRVRSFAYDRWAVSLTGVAFILAVYTMVRQRVSWYSGLGAAALISLTITAVFSSAVSSRTQLFGTLAAAAFMIFAMRGREPSPGKVAAVFVAVMLGLTFFAGLRTADQAPEGSRARAVSNTGVDAIVKNAAPRAVGGREWMAIGPISVLVHRVPDYYPYQNGKTMVSFLWAPIPRAVWPNKPPFRLGPEISPAVFGFNVRRITGDPPGLVGELWLNGGLIAVVVGMIVFGVLVRRVERLHQLVSATQGLAALLYGVLIIFLCLRLPTNDITGTIQEVVELLLPLTVLLWIVRERTVESARPILEDGPAP
jgi:hypothetical protein